MIYNIEKWMETKRKKHNKTQELNNVYGDNNNNNMMSNGRKQ